MKDLDVNVGLSDEERAAIAEEEQDEDISVGEDDIATLREIAEDDDSMSDRPSAAPRFRVESVGDYDARISALDGELQTALADFRAGDMDLEDYVTKQAEVQGKREELLAKKAKADIATDFNSQIEVHEWMGMVNRFLRDVRRDEGINYDRDSVSIGGRTEKLLDLFDRTVKGLAADPGNADKNGEWFLSEAHEMVKARFKLRGAVQAQEESAGPAADESMDDDEFSHLDDLTGLELEAAVARMTPAQQERWATQSE